MSRIKSQKFKIKDEHRIILGKKKNPIGAFYPEKFHVIPWRAASLRNGPHYMARNLDVDRKTYDFAAQMGHIGFVPYTFTIDYWIIRKYYNKL